MVDPTLVGGAVAAVGILSVGAYAYFTGNESSASVDVDDDGNDEPNVEFGGSNAYQSADGLDVGEESDTKKDVEEQADPTPEVVKEKDGLEDIKGIGPSRADDLADDGFDTPEDIYYANDTNLEEVNGIGSHAVSQMREDIGSIEDEGNSGESAEEAEKTKSEDAETDDEQSSSTEDETNDDSDSEEAENSSGNDSDEGNSESSSEAEDSPSEDESDEGNEQ